MGKSTGVKLTPATILRDNKIIKTVEFYFICQILNVDTNGNKVYMYKP